MPASRNPTLSSCSAHDRGIFIVVRPRVLSRKTAAAAAAMAAVLEKRIEMLQSELYGIGILDEQFAQLQLLEDESNPNFVSEMVTLYFEDTGVKLERLGVLIKEDNVNLSELDSIFHQLKGSSSSVGAQAMAAACADCREYCQRQDKDSVLPAYERMLAAFNELKERLMELLDLQKQLNAMG